MNFLKRSTPFLSKVTGFWLGKNSCEPPNGEAFRIWWINIYFFFDLELDDEFKYEEKKSSRTRFG